MAFATTTTWEVDGGSDANGGGFDPSNASMLTDLAATNANTSAPVVTSASYTFLPGDVSAWVYVQAGTNWTPGWYKITAVNGGAATLNATIGQAVLSSYQLTTVVGCATVASPTAGTWAIDYSQQTGAQFAYTDLTAAGAGSTYTSAGHPFGQQQVGNIVNVTSGTNCTVQRAQILSVSGVTATFDKAMTTGATSNGAGNLGGGFASPGMAGSVAIGQNTIFITGSYTLASATANVTTGCLSIPAGVATKFTKVRGYGTYRGDGTAATLTANGVIITFTVITCADSTAVENLSIDCNLRTTSRGVAANARCEVENVTVQKATNNGFLCSATTVLVHCRTTLCTTAAGFSSAGSLYECVADHNTLGGFQSAAAGTYVRCVAWLNVSGSGTSDGFLLNTAAVAHIALNCIAIANDHSGIILGSSTARGLGVNCISINNGAAGVGFGYNGSGAAKNARFLNCAAYGNAQGDFQTTNMDPADIINKITLTADPFMNSTTGDFRLNNAAGGGKLLRVLGYYSTMPGLLGSLYLDVGAYQHADTGTPRRPR